jgi:hypothetical protein
MTYAVAYSLHSVRGRPARHWHRKREAGTLAAWNPVSCPRQRRSALECTTRDEYACSAGVRVASGTVIRATIACVSLRSVWDTFVPLYQGRLNCACAPYAHVPTQALCTLSCTDNQCALTWPRSTNSHISVFVKSWVFSGVPLVRLIICLHARRFPKLTSCMYPHPRATGVLVPPVLGMLTLSAPPVQRQVVLVRRGKAMLT